MEKLLELKAWLETVKAAHQNEISKLEQAVAVAQAAATSGIPQERAYVVMLDSTIDKVNALLQ